MLFRAPCNPPCTGVKNPGCCEIFGFQFVASAIRSKLPRTGLLDERKRCSQSSLDARLLRQHGGAGRAGNPRLHSQPREGGSEIGPTQSLALTQPPLGGSTFRGRVSDPFCRPARLQVSSPRLCREILTGSATLLASSGAASWTASQNSSVPWLSPSPNFPQL